MPDGTERHDEWIDELSSKVRAGELSMDEAAIQVNSMTANKDRVLEIVDRFKNLDSEALAQEGPDSPAALINALADTLSETAAELKRISALRRGPLGPHAHVLDRETLRGDDEVVRCGGSDGYPTQPDPRRGRPGTASRATLT
jgi:hypothetical protein